MSVHLARRCAEGLVQQLALEQPTAIDIRWVAASFGAAIVEHDLSDIAGVLILHVGAAPMIVVNGQHTEPRKRFTIAHQLGHLLLQHRFPGTRVHVDRGNLVGFRHDRADPWEVEAAFFAQTLLMPTHLVCLAAESVAMGNVMLDWHVDHLAELFNVSPQLMTIRLSLLGLV